MKKFLSLFAAILFAAGMMAVPVVLPATLDVSNVSFRSEGMPDFVIEEGQDYAGTYFDMGAHDSSNDTLLYAEWDVTIEPIKYNLAVDVYNTNSWRVQLYLLNQTGDTLKSLRYKGSSGQKGQFGIGSLDLSDLEAGDYKVRVHAATAWSAMKLKDVIFAADYQGVSVALPGTLLPAYALLSEGASATASAIAFTPSTANEEFATWNVSFAKAGDFNVTIALTASNGHNYSVELLSEDGLTQIDSIGEDGQKSDTGEKELGVITVPAAGNYVVKLRNATQWSEALLNSISFAVAVDPFVIPRYEVAEAIAAGLTNGDEVEIHGIITKLEFKGKNFAKYGSVNVYVKDATGAEGEFEFYNCYSLDADTFKSSVPEYDAASTAWAQFTEVKDSKGVALHVGDTVIGLGKYKLFNTTHELDQGCFLVDLRPFKEVHTYTVAGNSDVLFGKAWDPADTRNDMVELLDGRFAWWQTDLKLAKSEIEFKVCKDHAYTHSWPAQNYKLAIPEDGIYTIEIYFDPAADDSVKVSAKAEKTGEAVIIPSLLMHGNFTGTWKDTDPFVLSEDSLYQVLKLELAAGDYEFGMKFDGAWKANGDTITRDIPSTSLAAGSGNMHIIADVAGEYTFVYVLATQTLDVVYPAKEEPMDSIPTTAPAAPTAAEDDVLAIYCNHYTNNNLNFAISGWAGGFENLDIEGTKVGYRPQMTWECIIDPVHTDDAHDMSGYKKLHVDIWAPKAAKVKLTVEAVAGGNYKDGNKVDLVKGWNAFDFVVAEWPGNYDFTNVKCFVWEQYQDPTEASFEGNPFAFANIYFYEKEAQAIDNTFVGTKAVKVIVNGQLLIIREGKTFNVMGQTIQ